MLAISVVVAAAGALAWQLTPTRHSIYTDANSIRLPADLVTPRDILWDAPRDDMPIPLKAGAYDPAMSADGLTFYFVRGEPGANADIWSTTRGATGWSEPAPTDGLNSPFDDMGPAPSMDGAAIYFSSDRPGGNGGYDLWVARRDADSGLFGEPVNLGPVINTRDHETGPSFDANNKELYFASNREPSSPVESSDPIDQPTRSTAQRNFDIFVAGDFNSSPVVVTSLDIANSSADDTTPAISPAGDFLYFASNRTGSRGGLDIYRVRLNHDAANHESSAVQRLDDTINTITHQTDPAPAMMGYDLYFRTFDQPGNRNSRIVLSHSREVFRATTIERASVDWNAVGAVIILALSAILLLLMARAMVDTALRRRLSLMAKCMLASVALHLTLAFLLSLWHVTASLAGWSPRSGVQRIALSPTTSGPTLVDQVRGEFGDSQPAKTTPQTTASPQLLAFVPPLPTSVREPSPPNRSQSASFQTQRAIDQPAIATVSTVSSPRNTIVAPRSPIAQSKPTATNVTTPKTSPRPAQDEPARQLAKSVAATTPIASVPAPTTETANAPTLEPAIQTLVPAMTATQSATPTIESHIESFGIAPDDSPTDATPSVTSRTPARPSNAMAASAKVSIPSTQRRGPSDDKRAESDADATVANAPTFAKPTGPKSQPAPIDGPAFALATMPMSRIEPAMKGNASKIGSFTGSINTPAVPAPAIDTNIIDASALPELPPVARASRSPAARHTPSLADAIALPGSTDSKSLEPLGPGWITGRVIDAVTREPIESASVELDRADNDPIIAATDEDGHYALKASGVPDHFALTASADDHIPASINIASSDVEQRVLWINFELPPQTPDTVAIETTPNVHHLGDDRFTGVINSRFQKRAEGGRYTATFTLASGQLPPNYTVCQLTMLTRGIQMAHPIYINGRRLEQALDWSPRDGRFGKFGVEIPIDLLREGENTILIRARKRGDDRDDFEFVNLQFHLSR